MIRWLATSLLVLTAVQSAAEEASMAGEPLRFRRVYVPADRVSELIRGEFIPRDREKFESLVAELSSSSSSNADSSAILSSECTARFDGRDLVDGVAILRLKQLADPLSAVPLGDCNLGIAMDRLTADSVAESRLGTTSDGRGLIFPNGTNEFQFEWSLKGNSSKSGTRFLVRLPSATSSRLLVELPRDHRLESSAGIVSRIGEESSDIQKWAVELGGLSATELTVVPRAKQIHGTEPAAYEGEFVYTLSGGRLSLDATLRLHAIGEELSELRVTLAHGLRLLSASIGGEQLEANWLGESATGTDLQFVFPSALSGAGRTLKIVAAASIVFDQDWALPQLSVHGVRWQQSQTSVDILAPLTLSDVQLRECRQIARSQLPAPNAGASLTFQADSEKAGINIRLRRRDAEFSYKCGTDVRLSSIDMSANVIAEFSAKRGTAFEIEMDVARPWVVDRVVAVTEEEDGESVVALADWYLENATARSRRLIVKLNRAVRASRTIRVEIAAHRPRPADGVALDVSQLTVVDVSSITREQHIVALHAEAPYRFSLLNDADVRWLDPQIQTNDASEYVSILTGGVYFEYDRGADSLIAIARRQAKSFSADVTVKVHMQRDGFDEEYQIRCEPGADTSLDNVVVVLSEARDLPIEWELDGEGEQALTATRLTGEQAQSQLTTLTGGMEELEYWQLKLRRPRDVPFRLVGRRFGPAISEADVAVAWLPQATAQEGLLFVGTRDGSELSIDDDNLKRVPAGTGGVDRTAVTRGVMRYRPVDLPRVTVSQVQPEQSGGIWAWQCQLSSQFGLDKSRHTATYKVETTGRRSFRLSLPADVEFESLFIEGQKNPPGTRQF